MRRSVRAFVLAGFATACAACTPPSVVLKASDPTFAAAQERLAATEQRVSQTGADAADRRLFLQAESFYDYRYSFPERSGVGYLAEAAAAVTDFPALQSLASSLDLADLRVRSSDGAIQLWETLLARSPDTPLRPLTLYRLGWAYRYTGVRGFPRKHPNDPFDVLAKESPDSPLARLGLEAKQVPFKSKRRATTLSLLVGGGQMYVGRVGNGVLRLSVGLASAAMIVAPSYAAYERRRDLRWDRDWPLLGAGVAGAAILSIDYTTAYEDAIEGVVRFNERREREFQDAHPDAP